MEYKRTTSWKRAKTGVSISMYEVSIGLKSPQRLAESTDSAQAGRKNLGRLTTLNA